MPLFDFECECGNEFEYLVMRDGEVVVCPKCDGRNKIKKLSPQSPVNFKLLYDPKIDTVDWDGNTSRYYDEYKKQKKEGKNVRIAQLDGDG